MLKAPPLFRQGQVLLIAFVTLLLLIEPSRAQDRAKIEIVPTVGHFNPITSVAFSPDGGRVLSGGDNTIKLWDVTTGALLRTFEGHFNRVTSVAFSPDGTRVLSGSHDSTIKLWDPLTGALIRSFKFKGHGWINSVAFSPDGARVLSGSGLGSSSKDSLKLWDANTGALILTFEGQSGKVDAVAFFFA